MVYSINEFAKMIGVSTQTLRLWDAKGILIANRLPSNHRRYDETHLKKIQEGKTNEESKKGL